MFLIIVKVSLYSFFFTFGQSERKVSRSIADARSEMNWSCCLQVFVLFDLEAVTCSRRSRSRSSLEAYLRKELGKINLLARRRETSVVMRQKRKASSVGRNGSLICTKTKIQATL